VKLLPLLASFTLGALVGCASVPKPAPVAAQPPAPTPLPASYDWHVLVMAPFDSTLKEIPFKLHEVLLFGEGENAPAATLECYGIDQEAPIFLTRTLDEYLLCFRHDRLAHIEAVVNLPKDAVQKTFNDACDLWLKNATPAAAATPDASARSQPAAELSDCMGTDGHVIFRAMLERDSEASDSTLTVKLDAEQP
jgi:hypothetical protein